MKTDVKELYDLAIAMITDASIPEFDEFKTKNSDAFAVNSLLKFRDGKLFGFTLRLSTVPMPAFKRGEPGVKLELLEWFDGKNHCICDITVFVKDDEQRRKYMLRQLIRAYANLAKNSHWLESI